MDKKYKTLQKWTIYIHVLMVVLFLVASILLVLVGHENAASISALGCGFSLIGLFCLLGDF